MTLYGPDGRPLNPEPASENETGPNAQTKADIDAGNRDPSIHCLLGVPPQPPTVAQDQVTCRPEKDWRDKTKFWFEIGGIEIGRASCRERV